MPVKRWNFRKAKWSHYIALTNKFAKTLLPPDSLDVDAAYQDFCNTIKKAAKKTIPIFRVGMQSVNPSIKLSCSLLRETTRVWLQQLYLPNLTGSGGIDGPKQFGASKLQAAEASSGSWSLSETEVSPLLPMTASKAGKTPEKRRSSGIGLGSLLF